MIITYPLVAISARLQVQRMNNEKADYKVVYLIDDEKTNFCIDLSLSRMLLMHFLR